MVPPAFGMWCSHAIGQWIIVMRMYFRGWHVVCVSQVNEDSSSHEGSPWDHKDPQGARGTSSRSDLYECAIPFATAGYAPGKLYGKTVAGAVFVPAIGQSLFLP